MGEFSAKQPTIGYLHQIRYALLTLLDNEEHELRLEELDDIDLTKPGSPIELLQLKHRAPDFKLTDASEDLWKTIRVWSEEVLKGMVSLDEALLCIITTAKAPSNSAAAYLKEGEYRNIDEAYSLLVDVAHKSKNKSLQKAFENFLSLDETDRKLLVSCVYVFDYSPNIDVSRSLLENKLAIAVRRQHRALLADRVEGWWFGKCIEHLRGRVRSLRGFDVYDAINELSQQFHPEALPIDFYDVMPSEEEKDQLKSRLFVRQLEHIGVGSGRIQKALLDYYRAFTQRSRWTREDLLIGNEVEKYESRLEDEWDRMRLILEDEMPSPAVEGVMQELGRKLLSWMETEADIRIRPKVTEPYVMRGSYHMLADSNPPKVWWHPEFHLRAEKILKEEVS